MKTYSVNIYEGREILKTIRARQWNMIGYILRHENKLIYRIIEGMSDRRRPGTSIVKQIILDAKI